MRAAALPPLLCATLLALLLLLTSPQGAAALEGRDAAFPGYKEEAAPECTDQLGAAICEVRLQGRLGAAGRRRAEQAEAALMSFCSHQAPSLVDRPLPPYHRTMQQTRCAAEVRAPSARCCAAGLLWLSGRSRVPAGGSWPRCTEATACTSRCLSRHTTRAEYVKSACQKSCGAC